MVMDFSYKSYKILLKKLCSNYRFTSFSFAKYNNIEDKGYLLLRHDIDQSLEKALEIAKIEHELGVSSTYFLFFKSPFYNIFANKEKQIINQIIKLNHFIGLHFDYSNNDVSSVSHLLHQIKIETDFIQEYFNVHVDAVSFHRPGSINFFQHLELKNYPHTYERLFFEKFKYFSDSRGYWRFGNPIDSEEFKQGKNLHILIHPIWWNKTNVNRLKTIENFKKSYNKNFEEYIYSELKGFWDEFRNKKRK